MFSLFDSLLANKGAWCVTFQSKQKSRKSVISPILQDIFLIIFYRIDLWRIDRM